MAGRQRGRSRSEVAFWIISVLVVLSMIVGLVLVSLPVPETMATPQPRSGLPTLIPDLTRPANPGEVTVPSPEATP